MQFIHLVVKVIGVNLSCVAFVIIRDNVIRVAIRSLFSKLTHIRNISFQEKMRPVIMRLLCKIVVTRIAVYVMLISA